MLLLQKQSIFSVHPYTQPMQKLNLFLALLSLLVRDTAKKPKKKEKTHKYIVDFISLVQLILLFYEYKIHRIDRFIQTCFSVVDCCCLYVLCTGSILFIFLNCWIGFVEMPFICPFKKQYVFCWRNFSQKKKKIHSSHTHMTVSY